MKTISTILLSLLLTVSYSLASDSSGFEDLGFMTTFFIAFGVLIVLFQFIPGLMLLCGMLKGLFTAAEKTSLNTGSK